MNICDIMKRNVFFVRPNTSVREAARLMHDEHVGVLPVLDMEDNKVIGMITDRDICCKVTATGRNTVMTTVADVMTKNVATCFNDQELTEVAYLMASHQIHRIAVLDKDDKLAGIVSVDDLAHRSHDLASTVLEASAAPAH
ncbi:MAG: CBS domain-containing protein [Gammaproteobacteria bacterium]|nr:CBS domain-containing protein [Gammaproteobacteria bacterium]